MLTGLLWQILQGSQGMYRKWKHTKHAKVDGATLTKCWCQNIGNSPKEFFLSGMKLLKPKKKSWIQLPFSFIGRHKSGVAATILAVPSVNFLRVFWTAHDSIISTWKKGPWSVGLYRGLCHYPVIFRDYFINHEIHGSRNLNQPGWLMESTEPWFLTVAQLSFPVSSSFVIFLEGHRTTHQHGLVAVSKKTDKPFCRNPQPLWSYMLWIVY